MTTLRTTYLEVDETDLYHILTGAAAANLWTEPGTKSLRAKLVRAMAELAAHPVTGNMPT